MGRAFSSLKRELKNYNVDNRALKAISQEKVRPPPRYPATEEQINIVKDQGVTVEDIARKNEKLNEYLRNIYVTSEGDSPQTSTSTDRPLPVDRITDWSNMEYGYLEPGSIPAGKITIKLTLELLSKRHEDSEKWTFQELANYYKLDVKFVETLIERYRVFELQIPDKDKMVDKKKFKDKSKFMATQVQLQLALRNIGKLAVISEKKKEKEKEIITK